MANEAPSSSSSHVSGDNNGNKILILLEGDGKRKKGIDPSLREDGADSQPFMDHMPSNLDAWVQTVIKKKGRISGLGFVGKTLVTSSSQPSKSFTVDVDALRNQIHTLNESQQRQEQEKLPMRQELT
ncbi:hypothetical protein E2542_SST18235 [Spatholobus suberectus]|nr:hypothetical protein E2542_SST18235 [Spatholobus suberectus]